MKENNMNEEERRRLIAIPVILAIAAVIAAAGSQGGQTIGNMPIFTLCVIVAFVIQWVAFIPAFR